MTKDEVLPLEATGRAFPSRGRASGPKRALLKVREKESTGRKSWLARFAWRLMFFPWAWFGV